MARSATVMTRDRSHRGHEAGARPAVQTILRIICYGALGSLALWSSYSHVFTHFATYDDQGYMVTMLRSFSSGSPLYEATFSQYGPFFALFHRVVFAAPGLTLDLNGAGLLQVGYWSATACIAGIAADLSTKRFSLGVLAAGSSFVVLSTLRFEPLHPIALIALLLAGVWFGLAVVEWWPRIGMTLVGVLAAALLLTKVNVGAFLILGLAFGISYSFDRVRKTVWFPMVCSVACVMAPVLLMRSDLTRATNPRFALVIGLATLSLVVVTPVLGVRRGDHGEDRLGWLLAGGTAALLIVVLAALATGTGLAQLIDGVLLRPLRQPSVFSLPWPPHLLPPSVAWFAIASTVVALSVVAWVCSTGQLLGRGGLSLMKLGAGLIITSSLVAGQPWPFLAMAPLAWIAAIGVPDSRIHPVVRASLPMIAVLQVLHAYPVAGAQLGVATFLLIGIATICFEDSWALAPIGSRSRPWWVDTGLVAASLGAAAVVSWGPLVEWWGGNWQEYRNKQSLDLPGADRYHLDGSRVATFHRLAEVLKERCSTFYSLPGLGSLYIFTGMDPPSGYFATDWMDLLTHREQSVIVERLEESPRPCIVRYENALDLWLNEGERLPRSPLVMYIESDYAVLEEIGPYELLVRSEGPTDA